MTASANGTRPGGQAVRAAPPSWREERRLDRLATAQIARDDQAARAQASIAAAEAADRRKDTRRQTRETARATARYRHAARRSALAAWFREHVTGLLFVPVIIVPAALAWTAMAAYGASLYGPIGVVLPAFSEGGQWVFAGATTITRHRHPDRPVWYLRLGTAVFTANGAVLNFAHGLASGSWITGVVMALISCAGVVAHQLITAGPRRTRAEREISRAARAAERRERTISRAARHRATAEIGTDGSVRLVYAAGVVALDRTWLGRARVTPVPAVGVTPQALAALRAQLGEERAKNDAAEIALRGEIDTAETGRREAEERAAQADARAEDFARQLAVALRAAREYQDQKPPPKNHRNGDAKPPRLSAAAARVKAAEALAADPGISGADLGALAGRTARWGQDFKKDHAPAAAAGSGSA